MGVRCWSIIAVLAMALAWSGGAAAHEEPPVEIDELEQAIEKDLAALTTTDCAVACKALESMMRSARRLCELDPGPRCVEARRKVDEARRKVREACPDCAAAQAEGTGVLTGDDDDEAGDAHPRDPGPSPSKPEPSAGEPEPVKKRGCAACMLGPQPDGSGVVVVLLLASIAFLRRRRAAPLAALVVVGALALTCGGKAVIDGEPSGGGAGGSGGMNGGNGASMQPTSTTGGSIDPAFCDFEAMTEQDDTDVCIQFNQIFGCEGCDACSVVLAQNSLSACSNPGRPIRALLACACAPCGARCEAACGDTLCGMHVPLSSACLSCLANQCGTAINVCIKEI